MDTRVNHKTENLVKILHVVPSFSFGGMEKVMCALINSTSSCYDHAILSLDQSKDALSWLKEKNIKFIGFNKSHKRMQFFKDLYGILHNISPDLLMTYNWGATDAIWLGRLTGIKRIIHNEHGFNVDEAVFTNWKRNLIRFFVYRMASKIIVVSHGLKNMIRNTFYIKEKKIVFIPNGINTKYYSPNITERKQVRNELGFQETDFVIGFSGRLDPIKNFDFMVDILDYCINRDKNVRLLIIGDGPEKKRLECLLRARKIQGYCIIVGKKEDVLPYLRTLDVFLLTSLREQTPMTLLEAMAVELPVVTSKVGDIPYIIEDEREGLVRNLNDGAEHFAQSLLEIKNSSKRAGMGRNARNRIVGHFQEERMVREYQDVLHNILS